MCVLFFFGVFFFFPGVRGHPSLLDQIHLHQLTRKDSLEKVVAGGQLLVLSQQLIFKSQCVSVPPEGMRPPRTACKWDVPLGSCEEVKLSQVQLEQRDHQCL